MQRTAAQRAHVPTVGTKVRPVVRPIVRPIVLVPGCNRLLGEHPFHIAGKKYIDAVRLAGALPLIVPNASAAELDELLELADGVLLTGSPSNVDPMHFGETVLDPDQPLDPERDAWTLPLIPKAVALGMPLFAICRGTQEANVAFGGSLHQAVHQVDGHDSHHGVADAPAEALYGPAHEVIVEPGGLLARLLDDQRFMVNSIHYQAVHHLGAGLKVEARAPDGVVEAFSVQGAAGFNLCVQWHPEWQATDNPISMRLFEAFGQACQAYRDHRLKAG